MAQYKNLPRVAQDHTPDEFVSFMDQVVLWVQQNKNMIIVGIILVVLLFVGVLIFRQQDEKSALMINQEIVKALKAENKSLALEEVLKKHSGKKAASLVPLELASLSLDKGEMDQALKALDQQLTQAPDFMKPALYGSRALLLLKQGKAQEALSYLDSLTLKNDYLILVKAWILDASGQTDEAIKLYEGLSKATTTEPFIKKQATDLWLLKKFSTAS